jgi:hypothetical protein
MKGDTGVLSSCHRLAGATREASEKYQVHVVNGDHDLGKKAAR